MKSLLIALPVVALCGSAKAHMPVFDAECGRGLAIHSDEGGPVYINGKAAPMMRLGEDTYEARSTDVMLTLMVDENNTPVAIRATWASGGYGSCSVKAQPHPHKPSWGRGIQLLSDVDGVGFAER